MTERRTAERASTAMGVLVYFGPKRGVFAGMVLNVSDAGLNIQLGGLAVPKRFGVSFDNFLTVRQCRRAWAKQGLTGAAFEPSARSGKRLYPKLAGQ